MPVQWSDEVDEIIGGDLAAGFAYLTPAKGVVIAPMAPLGLRDREKGTLTVTTSLGLWRKLDRIRGNSGVALAFHAREHGLTERPGYVLVQGRASFEAKPDRQWLESIKPQWERHLGPKVRGPAGRALRVYYWERVGIEIEVERIVAYPDTEAQQAPEVFGAALASPAPSQTPPKGGRAPRKDSAKLSGYVERLPHALLGWNGADDMPEVVPVACGGSDATGAQLIARAGSVPAGGRRAGLTAHEFWPRMIGQHQRIYTGWLEASSGGELTYAPHTAAGYKLPASKTALVIACSTLATRMRGARAAGLAS